MHHDIFTLLPVPSTHCPKLFFKVILQLFLIEGDLSEPPNLKLGSLLHCVHIYFNIRCFKHVILILIKIDMYNLKCVIIYFLKF